MKEVVHLTKKDSIAYVKLKEKEHKNTFSYRLIKQLKEVFSAIEQDPKIKVVIIHGYNNYFCCGGTKDELINLCKGNNKEDETEEVQFTDLGFYDLLLRCEVPVIAAMQGHALGGGLAFGCFADIIIMSEESIYSANFMKYGFTPGMGATYIIPKKFGELLGTEMLLSAKNYYGEELKRRGASAQIVSGEEVMDKAIKIAEDLADKPLLSLKLLKNNLTRQIRSELPEVIEKEVEMHEETFAQPEVLDRIKELFENQSSRRGDNG